MQISQQTIRTNRGKQRGENYFVKSTWCEGVFVGRLNLEFPFVLVPYPWGAQSLCHWHSQTSALELESCWQSWFLTPVYDNLSFFFNLKNREIGIDIYTLIGIKWLTNKNLLYKKINKIKFKNSEKKKNPHLSLYPSYSFCSLVVFSLFPLLLTLSRGGLSKKKKKSSWFYLLILPFCYYCFIFY